MSQIVVKLHANARLFCIDSVAVCAWVARNEDVLLFEYL